jgi:hypothetical protein
MIAFRHLYLLFHIFGCFVLLSIIFILYYVYSIYISRIYCSCTPVYICSIILYVQYVHFLGGGRTSTYFPAEELKVDVLSVQCVASTCVSVGMG